MNGSNKSQIQQTSFLLIHKVYLHKAEADFRKWGFLLLLVNG